MKTRDRIYWKHKIESGTQEAADYMAQIQRAYTSLARAETMDAGLAQNLAESMAAASSALAVTLRDVAACQQALEQVERQ